jgi:molecular chaperone Hsp33
VHWKCRCSRAKIEGTLASLDSATLDAMIEEDHGALVTCNFCSTEYAVTEERLREIRAVRSSSTE